MTEQASQFHVLSQNLQKLSTRTDYSSVDLEEAVDLTRECLEIQNSGAIAKHNFSRRAGEELNKVEDEQGLKAKKELAANLKIAYRDVKRLQKEAEVPEEDFNRYLQEVKKKSKEITDAGVRRASKKEIKRNLLSTAGRILKILSPWLDSSLLRSVSRKEYAGSVEEIQRVAELLRSLSGRFLECAKSLEEK